MSRTTDDWAALLDGTTPGPWQVGATTDLGHVYVGAANPDVGGIIAETGHADARLIALAPEAVAEVVRLRREVSAFRDQMAKSAENYKAMYERDRDLELLLEAECDREIASILTRILKGDNDD